MRTEPSAICFKTKQRNGQICVLKTTSLSDSERWMSNLCEAISVGEGVKINLNTIREPQSEIIPIPDPSRESVDVARIGILSDGLKNSPLLLAILNPLDRDTHKKQRAEFHEFFHRRRLGLWVDDSWSILHVDKSKDDSSCMEVTIVGHIAIQPTDPTVEEKVPSLWSRIQIADLKIPLNFGIAVTRRLLQVGKAFTEIQKQVLESHASEIPDGNFFTMKAFALSPSQQRQGIGSRVLDRLLEEQVDKGENGCLPLPCMLMTEDKANIALYESRGFVIVDYRQITLTHGCEKETPGPDDTFENWTMLRPAAKLK